MAQATDIEWTEQVWNFLRGCSRVSEGCTRCYAERQAIRHAGPGGPYEGLVRSTPGGPKWTGEINFYEDILLAPLKRKKPTTYFVNSMSDLFHEKVKDEWLDKAFAVMALTPQHTYQILTKRPERMREYFAKAERPPSGTLKEEFWRRWHIWAAMGDFGENSYRFIWDAETCGLRGEWPLKNVWLGVSVEDQKTADERIPLLLQTPAAVRWISAEPLLSAIDLRFPGGIRTDAVRYPENYGEWDEDAQDAWAKSQAQAIYIARTAMQLNWVVTGGESGPNARPCDIAWIRSIVRQCKTAGVACFVKQFGSKPFESFGRDSRALVSLCDRKGGDPDEWPPDEIWPRQFPNTRAEAAANA